MAYISSGRGAGVCVLNKYMMTSIAFIGTHCHRGPSTQPTFVDIILAHQRWHLTLESSGSYSTERFCREISQVAASDYVIVQHNSWHQGTEAEFQQQQLEIQRRQRQNPTKALLVNMFWPTSRQHPQPNVLEGWPGLVDTQSLSVFQPLRRLLMPDYEMGLSYQGHHQLARSLIAQMTKGA